MGIFDGIPGVGSDMDSDDMMMQQQAGAMNGGQQFQPVPAGQPAQPSPAETAMANQLYQMNQMVMHMQQQIDALRQRRVSMAFDLIRDDDGRVVSIQATEGRNEV